MSDFQSISPATIHLQIYPHFHQPEYWGGFPKNFKLVYNQDDTAFQMVYTAIPVWTAKQVPGLFTLTLFKMIWFLCLFMHQGLLNGKAFKYMHQTFQIKGASIRKSCIWRLLQKHENCAMVFNINIASLDFNEWLCQYTSHSVFEWAALWESLSRVMYNHWRLGSACT